MIRLLRFFKNAQEIKDERFKAFDEFHKWCVQNFPLGLRKVLVAYKIKPIADPKTDSFMGFDAKDILWWRGKYEADNCLMQPIEDIKKETMQTCLDIIDRLRINELDEKTKALYDAILNDTL